MHNLETGSGIGGAIQSMGTRPEPEEFVFHMKEESDKVGIHE